MPTFLSDPSAAFYIILVILVAIAVGIWFRYRDKGSLVRAGIAVGLLVLLFACDFLFESPREEAVRKVEEMAAMANAEMGKPSDQRNWNGVGSHISEQFDFNGINKAEFLKRIHDASNWGDGTVVVKEFDSSKVEYGPGDEIRIPFVVLAFPQGSNFTAPQFRYHVEGRFVKDADGQYRMRSFRLFEDKNGARGDELKEIRRP